MQQIKDEISKMLDYLGKDKFTNALYSFSRETQELTLTNWGQNCDVNRAHDKIHDVLIIQCREKAIEKWIDIEVANAGLLWCCHE